MWLFGYVLSLVSASLPFHLSLSLHSIVAAISHRDMPRREIEWRRLSYAERKMGARAYKGPNTKTGRLSSSFPGFVVCPLRFAPKIYTPPRCRWGLKRRSGWLALIRCLSLSASSFRHALFVGCLCSALLHHRHILLDIKTQPHNPSYLLPPLFPGENI